MKLELVRNSIKIDQLIKKKKVDSLVEGEITLPDHKPKIEKLISLDGEVEVTNQLLREDTLIVTGLVKFKTLYITEEDEEQAIHSLETKTDFREEIELDEAYDAKASVSAQIEHIEYTKLTDKKIGIKTVIDLEAVLEEQGIVDIIKDVEGSEGIQKRQEIVKYSELIASTKTKNTVKETFELEESSGDVLDILKIDTRAVVTESRVVDGKVIVAGNLNCFILYYVDGMEEKLDYIKEEIPFTHFAEVTGAEENMDYSLDLDVIDVNYDVRGDINGNLRIIDLETVVTIDAKVYTESEKEIITDIYSTVKKFDVKNESLNLGETLEKHNIEEQLKQVVETKSEMVRLCNVSAKPLITDKRILDEKVIVEGIVKLDLIYIAKNDSLDVLKSEVPFKTYVDVDKSDKEIEIEVRNEIIEINYNKLNDKEVEIEVTLTNKININTIKKLVIAKEVKELDELIDNKERSSITIYMVQKNDTVWDIAKRYSTTVEDITSTNDIEEDNLIVGEKIIIEKHLDTTLQAYT